MAVQPDPPIQIDPNMDAGHQWAFVNQNFASIANVLGKQSFNIVSSGTVDTPLVTATDAGVGAWSTAGGVAIVNHNLGYLPQVLAYISIDSDSYIPLPFTINSFISSSSIYIATVQAAVDINSVTFSTIITAFHTGISIPTNTIKYYLLQISAN